MTEAIGPLATVLQSEVASPPAIAADAAATLSVDIVTFATGCAERGIDSVTMDAITEDDDPFVNRLVLTILPETLVILALVVVFAA